MRTPLSGPSRSLGRKRSAYAKPVELAWRGATFVWLYQSLAGLPSGATAAVHTGLTAICQHFDSARHGIMPSGPIAASEHLDETLRIVISNMR